MFVSPTIWQVFKLVKATLDQSLVEKLPDIPVILQRMVKNGNIDEFTVAKDQIKICGDLGKLCHVEKKLADLVSHHEQQTSDQEKTDHYQKHSSDDPLEAS